MKRIPPYIAQQFEEFAVLVVAAADIDEPHRLSKWNLIVRQLEAFWIDEIELDRNNDEARRIAFDRIGTVEECAKALKQPFLFRFAYFQSYRAARLVTTLTVSIVKITILAECGERWGYDLILPWQVCLFTLLESACYGLSIILHRMTPSNTHGNASFILKFLLVAALGGMLSIDLFLGVPIICRSVIESVAASPNLGFFPHLLPSNLLWCSIYGFLILVLLSEAVWITLLIIESNLIPLCKIDFWIANRLCRLFKGLRN